MSRTPLIRSLHGPVPFCHLRLFFNRNPKSQNAISLGVTGTRPRAMRFARLDVVDRSWRRRLPGLPFLVAQSSRNELIRLDQRFSEDRLPALRFAR